VPNTTVHVLDGRGHRVPVGAVGELHLGGVQVAPGYHRRPGLTARRFVPDPFGPPGSRLYATGDLARWRDDGTVEFLGRIDGQVKLRGLRIELGEIEAALRDQPGVADAAAAVKEGTAGDKRLVAYLVGDADPATLREALKKRLPDYMVPAAFVPLGALPLSPAGKLDRKALPDPAPVAVTTDFVEPATDDERAIAAIWREVLGRDTVGAEDDFFALGGHSLLATQVVAKLRPLTARRGSRVGVMDLFQHPTVRGLAGLIGDDAAGAGPRRLLYELTRPVPDAQRVCSYVCIPYGGGSAVVYQPVADLMPAGHSLWSVGIPGHDIGLDDEGLAFDELVDRCATEVLERVPAGPLVLYGHCGVGGALVTELARRLEAAGRELDAVYAGGVFPFARPAGRLASLHAWLEDRASNRGHENWMKSMGVDMAEIEADQADRIISNMRRDSKNAEEHFTELLDSHPARLSAPFISVVGERDPITDYYQERYREWRFLTDTTAVVVLDEAGHFFLRYRAQDVVDIITTTHTALAEHPADLDTVLPVRDRPPPRDEPGRPRWWVEGVARADDPDDPGAPDEASMRRFAVVSFGQLISSAGSALTGWAVPVWLYLHTGSLALFGLTGVMAVVPILLATPIAGAVADRYDRRRVIMSASAVVLGVEAVFAALISRGDPPLWTIYLLVWLLSSAGTFQRIAFTAAIPQLAPKRFLGHANGVAQLINGIALLFVPVLAAGLLTAIGLGGILVLDIASYVFAIAVLALVRFPNLLGHRRRETFAEAVFGGWRLTWGDPAFRAMLFFFGIGNLLYAAPVLLVSPLVLSFAGTGQVGRAAVAEGLGALAGGLAMTIWGGPRRNRMIANILAIGLSGFFVRGDRAAAEPAGGAGRRARHGAVAVDRERPLHDDHPGEGAAAVPRPGLRAEPDGDLVDAADRVRRPGAGERRAGPAAHPGRRARLHRRAGHRHRTGARPRAGVRGPRDRDADQRPGGAADPPVGEARHRACGLAAGRPGRCPAADRAGVAPGGGGVRAAPQAGASGVGPRCTPRDGWPGAARRRSGQLLSVDPHGPARSISPGTGSPRRTDQRRLPALRP
jgi:surfactin synthase thioesterase subunit/MFS family permease